MPAVNQNPLTIKYRTRLAAAMLLEARGYFWAKRRYQAHMESLCFEILVQLEKTFNKFGTLHARGVARYIRELRNSLKVVAETA